MHILRKLLLPKYFGIQAVWFTQPLVDFVMISIGLIMQTKELNKTTTQGMAASS
ncbi:hypothetical protein [Clostridium botulinum]|uniref:hypothetical protein n=1 Tax=Clostridium botulinum TaxID=1491 RepID=UPI003DA3BA4B